MSPVMLEIVLCQAMLATLWVAFALWLGRQ